MYTLNKYNFPYCGQRTNAVEKVEFAVVWKMWDSKNKIKYFEKRKELNLTQKVRWSPVFFFLKLSFRNE